MLLALQNRFSFFISFSLWCNHESFPKFINWYLSLTLFIFTHKFIKELLLIESSFELWSSCRLSWWCWFLLYLSFGWYNSGCCSQNFRSSYWGCGWKCSRLFSCEKIWYLIFRVTVISLESLGRSTTLNLFFGLGWKLHTLLICLRLSCRSSVWLLIFLCWRNRVRAYWVLVSLCISLCSSICLCLLS